MFSMLPSQMPMYELPIYYRPQKPSPLSSSPLRSSPLSPRDSNAPLSPVSYHKMTPSPAPLVRPYETVTPTSETFTSISGSSSSRKSLHATKTTKTNPLIHGKNAVDGRETRRTLFLKRVRDDQEDKRWKARGGDDEIMRMIWLAEQRRREDGLKREALGLDDIMEEDGEFPNLDEAMVDQLAMQEEEELEAMLESLRCESINDRMTGNTEATDSARKKMAKSVDQAGRGKAQASPETPYASDDDEEYDRIFMDVIQEESRTLNQQQAATGADHDMMDVS